MERWEDELMGRVGSKHGWGLVEAFSRQMRCLPQDVCRGAEILVEKLEDCGVETVVHRPEIYLGIPLSATLAAGDGIIECKASALSPAVENLTAPLFHLAAKPSVQGVHSGDPGELFERRFESIGAATSAVSGRIVLTEGLSNPARTQLLQSWGALGVIVINPGDRSHWGTNSVIWGSPVGDETARLPRIASVAVSRLEGDGLLQWAHAARLVTMNVDALHGWFAQPVVTADIPGSGPEASSFVLLHSHYDCWEYGVGDNATGNAVLLEVARLFAGNPKAFRRSVRFAWWPGHSAGRYAGSAWYADACGPDLARNCIAHVNCDSPGCKDATSYASIRSMTEAAPLLQHSVRELFGQQCRITRPGRAGDYSFNNLGITGTLLTSSMVPKEERDRRGWYAVGGCGGSPAWHSEFDTAEVADRQVLENDTRLYALIAARLANEEKVPLDYCAALAEIRTHVRDFLSDRAEDARTRHVLDRFDAVSANLTRLYRDESLSPEAFNRVTRRLSRKLVRLGYAVGPAHLQDPAQSLGPVPLLSEILARSNGEGPERKIALLRALNALEQGLDDLSRDLKAAY